jgi:hypothetical protein
LSESSNDKDIDLPSSGGIRDAKKKKKEYVTESQEDQTEDSEKKDN